MSTHRETLMTRFYGAYRLKWKNPDNKYCFCIRPRTDQYIILMQNAFCYFDIGISFDLKGSTKSRTRLPEGETPWSKPFDGRSFKCNDFRTHMIALNIKESLRKNSNMKTIDQTLDEDSSFLMNLNCMDYSFLAGQIKTRDPDDPNCTKPTLDDIRRICAEDQRKARGVYITEKTGKKEAWVLAIIDPLNPYDIEKIGEYWLKYPKHGHSMSCIPPRPYKVRWHQFMKECFNESYENEF